MARMRHPAADLRFEGAPWQRNIHMRRSMPRLTPSWRRHPVGKREVGRYRQDERGIVHRLSRAERAQVSQRGEI